MKMFLSGKFKGKYTIIDEDDFEKLNKYSWYYEKDRYVYRMEKGKKIYLHREIMNFPEGKAVDHKNTFRLDNRRSNLREVTPSQNTANSRVSQKRSKSSKYKGVTFAKDKKRNKPWRATIIFHGKRFCLGYYATEKEAAAAYNKKALELHNEYARINEL